MKLTSFLSISLLFILIATSCSSRPRQYYGDGISDEENIRITGETKEARAFLDQFPESEILVDRSSKLAVDYQFTKVQPATTEQRWEGIKLRVFINPDQKRAEGALIQCSDQDGGPHFINEELIRYLEQYAESHGCPQR